MGEDHRIHEKIVALRKEKIPNTISSSFVLTSPKLQIFQTKLMLMEGPLCVLEKAVSVV